MKLPHILTLPQASAHCLDIVVGSTVLTIGLDGQHFQQLCGDERQHQLLLNLSQSK